MVPPGRSPGAAGRRTGLVVGPRPPARPGCPGPPPLRPWTGGRPGGPRHEEGRHHGRNRPYRPRPELPRDARPGRPQRAGPAPDPRLPGRAAGAGHAAGPLRVGVAGLSAVHRPDSPTWTGSSCATRVTPSSGRPGTVRRHALRDGEELRPGAAWVWGTTPPRGSRARSASSGTLWTPGSRRTSRSSSTRGARTRGWTRCVPAAGCASRSTASCSPTRLSCVMVFETGLPTRYYLDRVHVDLTR